MNKAFKELVVNGEELLIKAYIQGFAHALLLLVEDHGQLALAREMAEYETYDAEDFQAAGVDKYDLQKIAKALEGGAK